MMITTLMTTYSLLSRVGFLSLSSKQNLILKPINLNKFYKKNHLTWTRGYSTTIGKQNHLKNCPKSLLNISKEKAIILFNLIKSHSNLVYKDAESMMWLIFLKVWMLLLKREKTFINGRDFTKLSGLSTSVKKILKIFNFQISKSKSHWNILPVVFFSYFLIGNPPFLYKKLLNILWNKWTTHLWKLKLEDFMISSMFFDL